MANELTSREPKELSSDINVITAEINAYQRVAGEAIFEIGRRLKHVKETDLAHGEWTRWCEEEIGMTIMQANKFIKVFEEVGEDVNIKSTLGIEALYQIATLPPEHREVPHELPSGETKKPEEMTVRELRELKRQLKQAEQQAEAERKERERLEEEKEQAEKVAKDARDNLEKAKIEAEAMAKEPYGVKLGLAMYEAIEKLSEWQKEYSWIITDETEFRKLIEADPNIARMFNRVDKFWQQMSNVFHSTRNKGTYSEYENTEVIDAEFSEIL